MTDNTLTFETARGLAMQENAVTETSNSAAFPTGFSTNSVSGAANDVMVVLDTTVTTSKTHLIQALERIIKAIDQSKNLDG